MNILIFAGRLAEMPELQQAGDTVLTRFRLIRNEYAGKDAEGQRRPDNQVSVQFTAFGKKAELLANYTMTGDQLMVHASISNNHFTDKHGVERYEHNFAVTEIEFGAPGQEKRKKLAAEAR